MKENKQELTEIWCILIRLHPCKETRTHLKDEAPGCCYSDLYFYINTKFLNHKQEKTNKNSWRYDVLSSSISFSRETQKHVTKTKCQAVVYSGLSSVHKYKISEPEIKGNKQKLTELWYVSHQPLHSQKHATTKRHQAVIYPGLHSIHNYKIHEPETREIEEELTEIWSQNIENAKNSDNFMSSRRNCMIPELKRTLSTWAIDWA